VRDTLRHEFSKQWVLSYGADVLFTHGDIRVRLPPRAQEGQPADSFKVEDSIASDFHQALVSPAGFVELEYTPIPGLRLLPGLRVDRFDAIDQWVAQPRVTARWQFMPELTAKLGVGLFAQQPQFDEIDEHFGNPALRAERAMHYSAGVEYRPQAWLLFDVTGFYKDMFDLVSPTDRLTMRSGMPEPLRFDNGGKGRVFGAEITIRHEFAHNFTGWLVYTLSRAQRRDTDATSDRLFDFDQTHILTLVGTYLLPRNWQIGLRYRVVSGNPRTPVTGSVFDAIADRYEPIYGRVNSARDPLFHQLDLRVDKRWIFEAWMLTAYLDIQNVYGHENAEGLVYNYDYSKSDPQRGLPILPILGVRAEF
jgi:outer membrane receptor protein involved in Fe transport